MSVDTVLEAITKVRICFQNDCNDMFTLDTRRSLLLTLDTLRDPLLKEDIKAFDNYVDTLLMNSPDRADFILTEIFEHLGIEDREELSAILVA